MNLKKLIKESLSNKNLQKSCGCGCGSTCGIGPKINESFKSRIVMTENMKAHIDSKKPLIETTLPYGSKEYLDLWVEARYLYSRGALDVVGEDKKLITETKFGEYKLNKNK